MNKDSRQSPFEEQTLVSQPDYPEMPLPFGLMESHSKFLKKRWLVVFADLSALLLAMFIMIYAMSHPAPDHRKEFSEGQLTKPIPENKIAEGSDSSPSGEIILPSHPQSYTVRLIEKDFDEDPFLANLTIEKTLNELRIEIPAFWFKDEELSQLSQLGEQGLKPLSEVLSKFSNSISIIILLSGERADIKKISKALDDGVNLADWFRKNGLSNIRTIQIARQAYPESGLIRKMIIIEPYKAELLSR